MLLKSFCHVNNNSPLDRPWQWEKEACNIWVGSRNWIAAAVQKLNWLASMMLLHKFCGPVSSRKHKDIPSRTTLYIKTTKAVFYWPRMDVPVLVNEAAPSIFDTSSLPIKSKKVTFELNTVLPMTSGAIFKPKHSKVLSFVSSAHSSREINPNYLFYNFGMSNRTILLIPTEVCWTYNRTYVSYCIPFSQGI